MESSILHLLKILFIIQKIISYRKSNRVTKVWSKATDFGAIGLFRPVDAGIFIPESAPKAQVTLKTEDSNVEKSKINATNARPRNPALATS